MHNDQTNETAVTIARKLSPDNTSPFTCYEWVALIELRRRYRVGHDFWNAHEVERLRFLRWLYEAGKIES